jgi:MOSC domain-containing protein YiiM
VKLLSIQVGRPRDVEWRGKIVRTSIFKDRVDGPVRVGTLNLAGDEQSDLSVHGGIDKAVYAYPSEHYPFWRAELPGVELPPGAFGENLTVEGLDERTLQIGDRLAIGTAELAVTQPRSPCFKLGIRMGRADMVKRFQHSGRFGFYLAVLREGTIAAGDAIELRPTDEASFTVAEIARLATDAGADRETLRRASELRALAASWREHFRDRLTATGS